MKVQLAITLLFVLLLAASSVGQEISFGDQKARDKIGKKTSSIYDSKDKTFFLLTKKSFGAISTCGTEIIAYSMENRINRIVTRTCKKLGRSATEFYFENEKPIFVYRVFEMFREKSPPDSWKNFKGMAGWESRYYFDEENLKFHSHKGRKDILESETGKERFMEALAVLKFARKYST